MNETGRRDVPFSSDLLARLYERAQASRWGVSAERFAAALEVSCRRRFGDDREGETPAETVGAYLNGLHLEDLALACACRDGHAAAWEHFLEEILPRARASARAMAGEYGAHLADDLMADLYGAVAPDGSRRPLFDYFHGRSRLTTWLRTVIAQRHVDALRGASREVALDLSGHAGEHGSPGRDRSPWPVDRSPAAAERDAVMAIDGDRMLPVFERELRERVDRLPAQDRLRLAYYYAQGLTLARIGRLMGEHESSVSRKLERTRQQLRADLEHVLRHEHGYSDADIRQCLDEAAGRGTIELGPLLTGRSDGG